MLVVDEQVQPPPHQVDAQRWEQLAGSVLAAHGAQGEVELSVRFVSAGTMSELNERFMGASGPTDVLSFPLDPLHGPVDAPEGTGPLEESADAIYPLRSLGDIVICPEVAALNAPEHAGSYDDELALLLVHGVLHILGMDHAEAEEQARMWACESELLERFHGPLAADPWASS